MSSLLDKIDQTSKIIIDANIEKDDCDEHLTTTLYNGLFGANSLTAEDIM